MDSILISVKKLVGISQEDTSFDTDLIIHINSVFMILKQLGVGPKDGFSITSDLDTWNDFLADGSNLAAVKSYIYAKVRLLFDPPTIASVLESLKAQIVEFEWRLIVGKTHERLKTLEAELVELKSLLSKQLNN